MNWIRNKNTIEFLGYWEELYNPNFKVVEFDHFKNQAGLNSFVLSPQNWINKTNAIGIISKNGKNGGTYAHIDIAFEFATFSYMFFEKKKSSWCCVCFSFQQKSSFVY